ncbi:type III-D CRISPR-associated protein Csx19 [Lachnoanaerobaculum saburreum]|jgi:hypothetical protein|uniref:Putative CRISPR-associated protein, TIGR03984 family n=1 Tax=Lachnoanaerobaculum saburreum DSM 3986 TaxID=887325 RepID=E6LNT5_9FIRM|nr:CRISPR-associated protein Csx19 [Lachnoanaerobaculum saburreum]EFU76501.1 putative CRISPR-associated protein, TIGR03984 family [Lachnoanaerobaculum saburreum DSM 3986]
MLEVKSLVDFLNINKDFRGYALIQCTDCYTVLELPVSDIDIYENTDGYKALKLSAKDIDISENKLLEIRIFNEDEERRLFRLDLQDEFCYYVINDANLKPEIDYFDQQQILDIDTTKKLEGNCVRSTGGGVYTIPKSVFGDDLGKAAIIIRHYFGVTPIGQAYIKDFRCVKFSVAETLDWSNISGGKDA